MQGASPQIQKRIGDIRRDVMDSFNTMKEDVPIIGGFSKQDIDTAIKKREEALTEHLTSEPQFEVNDIKTNRLDDGSFQITGDIYNNITGEKSPFTSKKWNLTLDDNGEYHTVLSKALRNDFLNSPKYLLAGNERASEDFNKGLWAENLSQSMRSDLSDLAIRSNKLIKGNPVTKGKKRDQVNILLRKGDSHREGGKEVGKVYSYSELTQEGFTDDQIEYYYAQREIFDQMGFLHDKMLRDQMELKGLRDINLGEDAGHSYGKVYEEPSPAGLAARRPGAGGEGRSVNEILDTRDGSIKSVDDIDWNDIYREGGRLARLEDSTGMSADGNKFSHVIIDHSAHSDLPLQVMKHKPGYVPRIYRKGVYANTFVRYGTVDGVANRPVERKTVRLYDNQYEQKADKELLLKDAQDKGYNVGGADSNAEWRLIESDPNSPRSPSEQAAAIGGRMYTSPRGSSAVPFGSRAEEAEILDPLESMKRQLGHLANHYPRTEFKATMLDRIQKYADKHHID